jgi:chorismate synthase
MNLRLLTAGESHGPAMTAILEGMPAGLLLDAAVIDRELARRQRGLGSGTRMQIECDTVKILSGVLAGQTTGAPIALLVENATMPIGKTSLSPPCPRLARGMPTWPARSSTDSMTCARRWSALRRARRACAWLPAPSAGISWRNSAFSSVVSCALSAAKACKAMCRITLPA